MARHDTANQAGEPTGLTPRRLRRIGIARDRAGSWFLSWQHPTIAQMAAYYRERRIAFVV